MAEAYETLQKYALADDAYKLGINRMQMVATHVAVYITDVDSKMIVLRLSASSKHTKLEQRSFHATIVRNRHRSAVAIQSLFDIFQRQERECALCFEQH